MDKICTHCSRTFSTGPLQQECDCGGRMYSEVEAQEHLRELAAAIAYEAEVVAANVFGYARVPKGVLTRAVEQIDRLEQQALALGDEAEQLDHLDHLDAIALIRESEERLRLEIDHLLRQLAFKGYPTSRRRFAKEQMDRLRLLASGADPRVLGYHHTWPRSLGRLRAKMATT